MMSESEDREEVNGDGGELSAVSTTLKQITTDVISLSCRYCLNVDDDMTEPKAQTCSHVYCLPCLTTDREKNKITKCPVCRHVTDVDLESLPTVIKGEYKLLCDICMRDGIQDQFSKVYCIECATKFCHKHELMHEEILRSHDSHMIGMDEYKLRSRELEIRKCPEHPEAVLNMGCSECLKVVCFQCFPVEEPCVKGSSHTFMPVATLVAELNTVLEPLREEAKDKDSRVSELVKSTSVILSVWDSETEEMITNLHKTRDQQIQAIQQKYEQIETELRANRDKAKHDITKYLDEEAGVKMDELQTELLKFDAKLRDVHLLQGLLQDLIEEEFPSLLIERTLSITPCDNKGKDSRSTEMELNEDEPYRISVGVPLSEKHPPEHIELLREIDTESECITACLYRGFVYVGLNNGKVFKSDEQNRVSVFVKLDQGISSIRGFEGRIFILTGESWLPYSMYVYDTNAQLLASWKYSNDSQYFQGNKLVVDHKTVSVIDQRCEKILVFNRTGEKTSQTQCPNINNESEVVLCSGPSNSIIVSHWDNNQIFRLNMTTGKEEWMCKDVVSNPQGVTRYGDKYLLVTNKSSNRTTVWILDIQTGKKIGSITDNMPRPKSTETYDLFYNNGVLIIPRYGEKKVLVYKTS